MYFPNCYHIYNRGVEKIDIFRDKADYRRFILSMRIFNDKNTFSSERSLLTSLQDPQGSTLAAAKVEPWEEALKGGDKFVKIIAYCLNSNHYHFILEEKEEGGIAKFIQRLATGYSSYFNKRHERTGALFRGRYKKVKINSNERLLFLSAYVNFNVYVHGLKNFRDWKYSSLQDYIGIRSGNLCYKKKVLEQFNNNPAEYERFCKMICDEVIKERKHANFLLEKL